MDWGRVAKPAPRPAKPGPKAPVTSAPPLGYDEFCAQCERCRHFHPCPCAMNINLACTMGYTFEEAA